MKKRAALKLGLMLGFAAVTAAGCQASAPEAKSPENAEGKQSYAQAIALMCDVDKLGSIDAGEDPMNAGQKRSDWLSGRVDNPDGIYFRTLLAVKTAEEQAAALRDEAKKSGLGGCALSDSLEKEGMGGLVP